MQNKRSTPSDPAEYDVSLRNIDLFRAIRAERARTRREERESMWTSEEIREAALTLPAKVPIGRNKHKKNRKALAVKTIRKLWPRSRRARKMRLLEVDGIISAAS